MSKKAKRQTLIADGKAVDQPARRQRAAKPPQPQPAPPDTSGYGHVTIERVPIASVNPAPYNPRRKLAPGDPRYERIKRSLKEHGLASSFTWNRRTGNLVGGHVRFDILVREFAVQEIDVLVVDVPLAQEKALNVALNNPNIGGEWNAEALANLLDELRHDPSIDPTSTGFDNQEIEQRLEILSATTRLTPLDTRPPLAMTWALIGIPTVRFGEIAQCLDQIAALPETVCEVTASDG